MQSALRDRQRMALRATRYLHVTHQTTQDALRLMEDLCQGLPR